MVGLLEIWSIIERFFFFEVYKATCSIKRNNKFTLASACSPCVLSLFPNCRVLFFQTVKFFFNFRRKVCLEISNSFTLRRYSFALDCSFLFRIACAFFLEDLVILLSLLKDGSRRHIRLN